MLRHALNTPDMSPVFEHEFTFVGVDSLAHNAGCEDGQNENALELCLCFAGAAAALIVAKAANWPNFAFIRRGSLPG
jgi:hypothetical protein